MSSPYRPDFVEVEPRGEPRLHGRCPHCEASVAVRMAKRTSICPACTRSFELLMILPVKPAAL